MARNNAPTPSLAGFIFLICMFILAIYLMSCGPSGGGGNPTPTVTAPTIAIENDSSDMVNGKQVWSQEDLTAYIPIMQAQMHEVAEHWGARYDSHIIQTTPVGHDIPLTFTPGNNPSNLPIAYHSVDDNNNPFAQIFVGAGLASGNSPLLEGEHEAMEVTVDPSTNGVEIVDPVVCLTYCEGEPIPQGTLECGENGTTNNGNIVPDFVFPNYFKAGSKGPWDMNGIVQAPGVSHCH